MTHDFEGVDFFERRFDRADVRAITGLTDKKLDTWTERRLIPAEDQRPGKGGRRRYHGFELFALKLMGTLTERFRIPPADAMDLAQIVTREIIKQSHEQNPDLMIERLDFENKKSVRSDAYVLLWYEAGDWQLLSDFQHALASMSVEIRQRSHAHISLPITTMFHDLVGDVCERVYGTEWRRKKILELPVEQIRALHPEILEELRITEADLKARPARKTKARTKKRAAKKK